MITAIVGSSLLAAPRWALIYAGNEGSTPSLPPR